MSVDQRLLRRVQSVAGLAQMLDRQDLFAVQGRHELDAGIDRAVAQLAIDDLAEAVAGSFSALERAAGVYAAAARPGSPRSATAAST